MQSYVPFLDVLLTHNPDGLMSTLHQSTENQLTHTDKYLQFESHHPLSHKISVVNTLLSRAHIHSSSASNLSTEVDHVVTALRLNGYPKPLLSKHASLHAVSKRGPSSPDSSEWKSTAVLPHVRGLSESIRRVLRRLQIRVCFKPLPNLRSIFLSAKDRPPLSS